MTVTDNSAADTPILPEAGQRAFGEDGFTVVRGLFGYDEIDRLCAEFAALHAAGPVPGHFEPVTRRIRCTGIRG